MAGLHRSSFLYTIKKYSYFDKIYEATDRVKGHFTFY